MYKSFDEECVILRIAREMAVGVSHLYGFTSVTSELRGRKRKLVEPLRDCCVKA